jgi:DNA-binding NarL/FixJ family response regulator
MIATVVIADDDAMVRDALAGLLGDHHDLRVVGLAGSGVAAAALCGLHRPTLAVVDVMMPDGGDVAIRAIRDSSPATVVTVYTARSDRRTRERMLAAGATAVFTKGGAADLADELAALARRSPR